MCGKSTTIADINLHISHVEITCSTMFGLCHYLCCIERVTTYHSVVVVVVVVVAAQNIITKLIVDFCELLALAWEKMIGHTKNEIDFIPI